jgi:hypothetical protein
MWRGPGRLASVRNARAGTLVASLQGSRDQLLVGFDQELRPLPVDARRARFPAGHPSGERIAWVEGEQGAWQVVTARLDGSDRRAVRAVDAPGELAYRSDGRLRIHDPLAQEMIELQLDGSEVRSPAARLPRLSPDERRVLVVDAAGVSVDGTRIAAGPELHADWLDDRRVVVGGPDGHLVSIDVHTGERLEMQRDAGGPIADLDAGTDELDDGRPLPYVLATVRESASRVWLVEW